MSIDLKLNVSLTLDESALEDALAEYDELQVNDMIRQVLDKAIALDDIRVEVVEGPKSLDDYDTYQQQSG
jgi:hypothetical protein